MRDWFHSNLKNNCECALIIKDNRWYIYGCNNWHRHKSCPNLVEWPTLYLANFFSMKTVILLWGKQNKFFEVTYRKQLFHVFLMYFKFGYSVTKFTVNLHGKYLLCTCGLVSYLKVILSRGASEKSSMHSIEIICWTWAPPSRVCWTCVTPLTTSTIGGALTTSCEVKGQGSSCVFKVQYLAGFEALQSGGRVGLRFVVAPCNSLISGNYCVLCINIQYRQSSGMESEC